MSRKPSQMDLLSYRPAPRGLRELPPPKVSPSPGGNVYGRTRIEWRPPPGMEIVARDDAELERLVGEALSAMAKAGIETMAPSVFSEFTAQQEAVEEALRRVFRDESYPEDDPRRVLGVTRLTVTGSRRGGDPFGSALVQVSAHMAQPRSSGRGEDLLSFHAPIRGDGEINPHGELRGEPTGWDYLDTARKPRQRKRLGRGAYRPKPLAPWHR